MTLIPHPLFDNPTQNKNPTLSPSATPQPMVTPSPQQPVATPQATDAPLATPQPLASTTPSSVGTQTPPIGGPPTKQALQGGIHGVFGPISPLALQNPADPLVKLPPNAPDDGTLSWGQKEDLYLRHPDRNVWARNMSVGLRGTLGMTMNAPDPQKFAAHLFHVLLRHLGARGANFSLWRLQSSYSYSSQYTSSSISWKEAPTPAL